MSSQLTHQEMKNLTAAGTKSRQIETLIRAKTPYLIKANGWPTTTWDAVNAALNGKTDAGYISGNHIPENTPGFDISAAQ